MQRSRDCGGQACRPLPSDSHRFRLLSGARHKSSGLVLACMAAWLPASLFANDDLTPEDLRHAIRQLDADEFAVRQAARQRIAANGGLAVEFVRDAASVADGHLASECVRLLEQLAVSDDTAVAGAAQQALDELSRNDNPATAALAQAAISPAEEIQPLSMIRARVGAMAINVPPQVPFDANGKRHAEFEDGERQVRITEQRGGPITVEMTRTVDGAPQTTEVQADSAAALHRKSREAYELYARKFLRAQPPQANLVPVVPRVIAGGRQMRVTTTIVNGEREIKVATEDQTLTISDRNGADIRIEWATMEKGVESIRTIESPDLPTLMAADRQAALEYLRYTQGGGGRDAFPAMPMRSATRE